MDTREEFKNKMIMFAKRPAMYVGRNNLEYMRAFYNGWSYAKWSFQSSDMFQWYHDYDMQKWLFLQESASFYGVSITGWELFERCYGIKDDAIEKFQKMVYEIPFSDYSEVDYGDTVASHINKIYSVYHWGYSLETEFKAKISEYYYPLHQSIRDIIGDVKDTYESIIPFVRRMIKEPSENILVYIHYECYFMQVRFFYYSESKGWIDQISLNDGIQYYHDLVILHAYCALVQKEEHKNHTITLNITSVGVKIEISEVEDIWYHIFNTNADITLCEKNPFQVSLRAWRKKRDC